jgi:hypothetical protein
MNQQIVLSDFTQDHIESASACKNWKERSDAAYLAGFVGIACIFSRFSITPLIWQMFRFWQNQPGIFDLNRESESIAATLFTLSIPLPGIPAVFALWLGVRACQDLERNPNKVGAVQAGFAFLVGVFGTIILLTEIYQVVTILS